MCLLPRHTSTDRPMQQKKMQRSARHRRQTQTTTRLAFFRAVTASTYFFSSFSSKTFFEHLDATVAQLHRFSLTTATRRRWMTTADFVFLSHAVNLEGSEGVVRFMSHSVVCSKLMRLQKSPSINQAWCIYTPPPPIYRVIPLDIKL